MAWWMLACGGAPAPVELPAPRHGDGWEALTAAVARGDVPTARVLARDFSLGDVDDGSPATGKVGGGLGFLQLASDPEEARDALAAAREGCDACHAAKGVDPIP